jgi:hypothetical protein
MTPKLWDDAHRRVCIAKDKKVDPRKSWHGLAMPSEMKKAVAEGIMEPVYGERPRVLCWYKLTTVGWVEYNKRYAGKPNWFSADHTRLIFTNNS